MRTIALLFIALSALTLCRAGSAAENELRMATFNVAMGLPQAGQLGRKLSSGQDPRLRQVAEILQRVRPDIILLNEFDYDPDSDAATLLNENYLAKCQNGQLPIYYPYSFRGPVNTGIDSGLDLDGNGTVGEPQDAWGFGNFPGQYGMLVLSRFPIREEHSRSFRLFPWSALPDAQKPLNPDGSAFYPDDIWRQLRLSSKSHWDLLIDVNGHELHFLVSHPTPPVFDGPEDRNGKRNYDENHFWIEYLGDSDKNTIVDDQGHSGGLKPNASFVIAGDLNADALDGDSIKRPGATSAAVNKSGSAAGQLLAFPQINAACTPRSSGAPQASAVQGGKNRQHRGDPAADTTDFNDERTGNLRLDYVLPSADLTVLACGVFWPAQGEPGHQLISASDHRLVWLDISL